MSSSWTDAMLVQECLSGSQKAWQELIRRYGPSIYGATAAAFSRYGLASRRDLIDDVYQQVFTEIFEKNRLAGLRDGRAVRSFLTALAVSRSVDAMRTISRKRNLVLGAAAAEAAEADPAADAAQELRHNELIGMVEREISSLTFKEAYILRLNAQEELTHEEISELLGIPKDTISTIVRRAKDRVREALRQKGITE